MWCCCVVHHNAARETFLLNYVDFLHEIGCLLHLCVDQGFYSVVSQKSGVCYIYVLIKDSTQWCVRSNEARSLSSRVKISITHGVEITALSLSAG